MKWKCLNKYTSKKHDPIRLRNNFSNLIQSEINIVVPKSERIRWDRTRIQIGFELDSNWICTPLL